MGSLTASAEAAVAAPRETASKFQICGPLSYMDLTIVLGVSCSAVFGDFVVASFHYLVVWKYSYIWKPVVISTSGVFFFFFFFFFRYSLSSINTVNQNCASKESDIMTFGNFVIAFRCLTVWKIKRRPEFCCDFC